MLQKIISKAAEKGFSVETESSPYGYYKLNKYELAFLCNNCGEEIIINLLDGNVESKIEDLSCKSEECFLEEDFLTWTKNNRMSWCYDGLRIISSIKLTEFNALTFETGEHLQLPEDGDKDVYVAADPTDENYAYVFVVYQNETDAWLSKYFLFRYEIATWGTQTMNVTVCTRWPYYYEQLHKAILNDLASGDQRTSRATIKTFDCYIKTQQAARKNNEALWGFTTLWKVLDKVSETLNKYVESSDDEQFVHDQYLKKYLSLHTCPVCKEPYTSKEKICCYCKFPELNRQFINRDDAIYWETHILEPYRSAYEKKNSQPKQEVSKEVIASSNDYFNIGYTDNDYFYSDRLYTLKKFNNSPNVTKVVIPSEVQRIGNSAFAGANNLRHIVLPSGLKEIGFTAFSECSKLQYIILPNSIEKIDRGAFQQTGLKAIFSEAISKPSKWLAGWNLGCGAKIYWKNEWHYDKNGNPVINKQ